MSSLSKSRVRRAPARAKAKPAAISTANAGRYPTIDALVSDIDPALSPAQRARHDARKEWARGALARLKTVNEWRATATESQIRAVEAVFGSIESSHARMVRELENEAVSPTPSEIHHYPDGSYKGVW